MTRRRPSPAAPGPLEGYAARFDDLFTRVAQRRGFREELAGMLAPRDRKKKPAALARAGPAGGAEHPAGPRAQVLVFRAGGGADVVHSPPLGKPRAGPGMRGWRSGG